MTDRELESQLTPKILLALCGTGEVLLERNNIGLAWFRNGNPVKFGVGGPGGSDFVGTYRGRALYVELKTPTGRQSPEQRQFQQKVERHGAIYRILRSVEDAQALLAELRALPPLTGAA
jgi:hypothetical protein